MSRLDPLFRIPPPPESVDLSPWEGLNEKLDKIGRLQIKMQAVLEADRTDASASAQDADSLSEDLIQLLDGLDHCLSFLAKGQAIESDNIRDGLDLLRQKGLSALEKRDIRPIDTVDVRFDPSIHTAVDTVSQENVEDYIIVGEEKRGYLRGDQVLRPAEVIVNRR